MSTNAFRLRDLGGPVVGLRLVEGGGSADIGLIQGRRPASKQEWFTAVGLWTAGWDFWYQVPIRGGYVPGGQVLDFLVDTPPRPTPLQPFSTYYHRGHLGVNDRWKLAIVRQTFGVEPVIFWSNEVDTREKGIAMVRRTFGFGPGRRMAAA